MNASEIKIDLFRKIDALKDSRLKEVYGMFLNFINSKKEIDNWDSLTKEQLNNQEEREIQKGIEIISSQSKSFAFLNDEEDLYDESDLIEKY